MRGLGLEGRIWFDRELVLCCHDLEPVAKQGAGWRISRLIMIKKNYIYRER